MAQHFLLSPVARALADDEMQLSLNNNEPLAYALFMLFRWGSLTQQVCPRCGVIDAHIPRPKHKQWRCRSCQHDFSLKSGSLLDGTKLPYWKVLKALYLWSTEPKGLSATTVSRKCGVTYEAAYLLLHKFRWTFWNSQQTAKLSGTFEIDVVWVLKGYRKANDRRPEAIEERNVKRRHRLEQEFTRAGLTPQEAQRKALKHFPKEREPRGSNPKKQPILAIVQRTEENGRKGSSFVVGFPIPSESYEHVAPIVQRFIEPGSRILTDGAGAYSGLAAQYELEQVDHDQMYSRGDGVHTNFVESCFARWRRMEIGTHHKMNPRTLHLFFADCAWRETERRTHPIRRFTKALQEVASAGVCRAFKKYGYTAIPRDAAKARFKEVMEQLRSKGKPRVIELKPIQRVGEAVLGAAQAVLGGLVHFTDSIEAFFKASKPAAASAFAVQPQEAPKLWTLGARKRKGQANAAGGNSLEAGRARKSLMQSLMGLTAPAPATPVYSFTVSGMLANCLRA